MNNGGCAAEQIDTDSIGVQDGQIGKHRIASVDRNAVNRILNCQIVNNRATSVRTAVELKALVIRTCKGIHHNRACVCSLNCQPSFHINSSSCTEFNLGAGTDDQFIKNRHGVRGGDGDGA